MRQVSKLHNGKVIMTAAIAFAALIAASAGVAETSSPIRSDGGAKGLVAMSDEVFSRLESKFEKRVAAILAMPNMSVPEGAERRYISAKTGDDAADGKTPMTAWRTAARLKGEALAPGAFVLFERGGIYRGSVSTRPGVTYTAYGEGPKPRIYVSPEDGADPAKWERTEVEGIWRYKIGEQDVGTLVFDGGRAHAVKIVPVGHGDGTFTQQFGGRPFNNGYADLAGDLHFWHDYSAKTKFQPHAKGTGYLYLRSRDNPGSRFRSIEFSIRRSGFSVGRNDGVTIDNMCVMYVGAHGVGAGTVKNLKVTNCEFGWIGGSIQAENFFGRAWPTRFGNAVEIYGGCDGFTVEKCYVHDVYDAGLTHQYNIALSGGSSVMQKNVRYADNAIERCNYSIEYFLSGVKNPDSDPSRMENVVIENNYMRDAAVGFCKQRPDVTTGAHIKGWRGSLRNRAAGFVVKGNVFSRSDEMFVEISSELRNPDGSDSMPELSGNVFVGRRGQRFGVLNQGKAEELKYDDELVRRLGARYADNVYAVRGDEAPSGR